METKTVLLTGASSGIGYATAGYLLRKGVHVFGSVRQAADASRLQKQLGTEMFTALLFDVTDEKAVSQAADKVRSALQGHKLTALINNAGIGQIEPTAVCSLDKARRVIDTNLTGTLICAQAFLPLLGTDRTLTGPPGRIVQMSSVLGQVPVPYQAVYSAAKHGLEAMTACLRRELAPYGIKLVSIRPGPVASEFWDKIDWTQYQGTPWEQGMKKTSDLVANSMKTAVLCEAVAEAVYQAVMEQHPRSVYHVISWDGRVAFKLLSSLPPWLVDLFWVRALRKA